MCIFSKLNTQRQPNTATGRGPAFVAQDSIVRQIWGSSDVVLFIFAGAAAEFALNKSVDWLYYTGKLPKDPLARMFSTVDYARRIIFLGEAEALAAIDSINAIHKGVETKRGMSIPQQSYKDVLYMLMDYSVRAYELIWRPLTAAEKEEVYHVFYRMGCCMGITGMPVSYGAWLPERASDLQEHLLYSKYTYNLFRQYRLHLGPVRYNILLQVQVLLLPPIVKELLGIKEYKLFTLVLRAYKVASRINLGNICKRLLLPPEYKERIMQLDVKPSYLPM